MSTKRKANDFRMEVGLHEGQEWSAEKLEKIKAHAQGIADKRSSEQQRRNEMEAIRFRMEEYANTEENKIETEREVEDFVLLFLATLDMNFKTFAQAIESSDSNLKKYMKGERKFNEDLACRFGKFFHTSPLTWMRVQHKNDLLQLSRMSHKRQYQKYDYEKVVNG